MEDTCIGCGLCATDCPVNAIEMKDGKLIWTKKNCSMCLGCLHRSPKFAIQHDNKTKNHGQYLHPDEKQVVTYGDVTENMKQESAARMEQFIKAVNK